MLIMFSLKWTLKITLKFPSKLSIFYNFVGLKRMTDCMKHLPFSCWKGDQNDP